MILNKIDTALVKAVALPGGEAQIWQGNLNLSLEEAELLVRLLPEDEQERAGRFHFKADANRYLAGRWFLRQVLGSYLEIAPGSILFQYSPSGKPALTQACNPQGLQFNLTHSLALALVAVARKCRIGIDLEFVRAIPDTELIVERFFTPKEQTYWRDAAIEQKNQAFFTLWTAKEAYLKALGLGLGRSPETVTIPLPAQDAVIRTWQEDGTAWHLENFSPAEGYLAAVVVEEDEEKFQV